MNSFDFRYTTKKYLLKNIAYRVSRGSCTIEIELILLEWKRRAGKYREKRNQNKMNESILYTN